MPVDSPFFDLHDESGLKQEVTAAVALGFPSKAAIHPAQIDAINAALTPSAEAVERARKILAENVKGVRATIAGLKSDPKAALDVHVPMDPALFDMNSLSRYGK